MQISEGGLKSQEVLWLPGSLCSLYRIPFDPNPAEQEFPPPCVALILHTGTLVARLHGVETIREFVTGAAVTLILDLPFLLIFLAVMFAYSWQLSLIAVGLLGLISILSFLVAPVFRDRLNQQFMLGARNQSFLTEYVSGMATVKSLQMEPDIDRKYSDFLAQYLAAGFSTKQVGNTYNVIANGLEQVMTLSILIVGALLVMQNDYKGDFPHSAGGISQPASMCQD